MQQRTPPEGPGYGARKAPDGYWAVVTPNFPGLPAEAGKPAEFGPFETFEQAEQWLLDDQNVE